MITLEIQTRDRIEAAILTAVRRKLEVYEPETDYKPFHTRLLGRDRMQLYSFIHSLVTNFGSAIYEPVAAALATRRFASVELQRGLPMELNSAASIQIDEIIDGLLAGNRDADRVQEEILVRRAIDSSSATIKTRVPKVDLWLEGRDGSIMMFELKTVKPNIGNFEHYKRNLLRSYALGVANFPGRPVRTALALPYNPYHPEPYRRWTLKGMLDLDREVYIAEDFWNFLAGADIHDQLLGCFERAGITLRDEIDAYFKTFRDQRGES